MSQGWFKIYRELFDKAIWRLSTPEQKVVLITLIGMANHQEKEWEWQGKQFKAEPGQFVTSLDSICEKCGKGISIQNIRSALTKFKKYNFLTEESTKTGRLITIVNWGLYQGVEEDINKHSNIEATKKQQRVSKDLTANKKDKNIKNDKKAILYDLESNEYRLAVYLYNFIKKNNDKAKEPNYQSWANEFRKILDIDKRDLEEVKNLIAWCQSDSFWHVNILSPKKLRDKYDQLLVTMKNVKQGYRKNEKPSGWRPANQRVYDLELERKLLEASEVNEDASYTDTKDLISKIRGER